MDMVVQLVGSICLDGLTLPASADITTTVSIYVCVYYWNLRVWVRSGHKFCLGPAMGKM